MTPSMHLSVIKASYAGSPDSAAICHDLDRAFSLGHEFGIERAAGVVDQCNKEGPYNAVGAGSRIRALVVVEAKPDRSQGGGGSVGIMANELELAKYTLFDPEALGAKNFKLYPGSGRETTPAKMAEQINKSIADVLAGNFEYLEDDQLD